MARKTSRQGQDNGHRFPLTFYWVSVAWGALLGLLLYVSARFPAWYLYLVGPSSEERGSFWDAGVLISMALSLVISAGYFWLVMRRRPSQRLQRWAYLWAAILVPVLILALAVVWWYADSVRNPPWPDFRPDLLTATILWLTYGIPALACLIPFGLLSSAVFSRLWKRRLGQETGQDTHAQAEIS